MEEATVKEWTGDVLITQHDPSQGRSGTQARWAQVGPVTPYCTTDSCVCVFYKQRGSGRVGYRMASSDSARFITVELAGKQVWDSRTELPNAVGK
jgi:hypothetical protein